MGFIVFRERL